MKSMIVVVSFLLTMIVIGNAYQKNKQYYPTVIYITKSNPSMAVMYAQVFILALIINKLFQKVFFGELSQAETDLLMEQTWHVLTDTCFAFTAFRSDLSPKFVALFTLLFFLKLVHWLTEERVNFMERRPIIYPLFHLRILSLILFLGALDLNFIKEAYETILSKETSVQLAFGLEYGILLSVLFNIVIKYILHSVDLYRGIPWEQKSVFLLYIDLLIGFFKLALYVTFGLILMNNYTLPLFAVRATYNTFESFKKAVNDVIMSYRAIRNMNNLYPNATAEELAAFDNVCIICREEMNIEIPTKKLPCDHIFHTSCLRLWFQRQQTCPTCRMNVLRIPTVVEQQQNRANHQQLAEEQQRRNNSMSRESERLHEGDSSSNAEALQVLVNALNSSPHFPFNLQPPSELLKGLSEDELKKLEMESLEGLKARVKCLQDIQVLLDVSHVLLQQYYSTVVRHDIGVSNEATKQDNVEYPPRESDDEKSEIGLEEDKSDVKLTGNNQTLHNPGMLNRNENYLSTEEKEFLRQSRLNFFSKFTPTASSSKQFK